MATNLFRVRQNDSEKKVPYNILRLKYWRRQAGGGGNLAYQATYTHTTIHSPSTLLIPA